MAINEVKLGLLSAVDGNEYNKIGHAISSRWQWIK